MEKSQKIKKENYKENYYMNSKHTWKYVKEEKTLH